MKNEFKDYYKIMQIHYDATEDMLQAAYQRLSEASDTPRDELEEAYAVLSDSVQRASYQQEWMKNLIARAHSITEPEKTYRTVPDDSNASAEDVLADFFRALQNEDWENAYCRLTKFDQSRVSFRSFVEWREAILSCYKIQDYEITYVKPMDYVVLDMLTYPQPVEFLVTVNENHITSSETTTDTLRKYVAFEDGIWRVCLGIRYLQSLTLQYQQLGQTQSPAVESHYKDLHFDALTGLLSESGFYEEAAREVARYQRYNNPFSLLSFQLHCNEASVEQECMKQLAEIIRNACRSTDLAARLDNNQIICLLIETKKENAEAAAQKFLRLLKEQSSANYSVSFGLVFYNGYSSLADAVLTCCHMAGMPSHY